MAGDWMKLRLDLPDDPRVIRIAAELDAEDPDLVVGKLVRLWAHANKHTADGRIPHATFETIDRLVGYPGFAEAVGRVGWICEESAGGNGPGVPGVTIVRFEEHNSNSAKRRALAAARQAKKRSGGGPVTRPSRAGRDAGVTAALPREEKRREENTNTPPPPPSGGVGAAQDEHFAAFWAAYPKKVGKLAAKRAWARLRPDAELRGRILAAVEAQKASAQWRRENGRFIPHPATWLNQGRWDDEVGGAGPSDPEAARRREQTKRVLAEIAEAERRGGPAKTFAEVLAEMRARGTAPAGGGDGR